VSKLFQLIQDIEAQTPDQTLDFSLRCQFVLESQWDIVPLILNDSQRISGDKGKCFPVLVLFVALIHVLVLRILSASADL
jgi:hypothetical protein